MNEQEFQVWMNEQPSELFERFNEIKMPTAIYKLSRRALYRFFKDRGWLVWVRDPKKKMFRLTVVWFNKETGEWSNYK